MNEKEISGHAAVLTIVVSILLKYTQYIVFGLDSNSK